MYRSTAQRIWQRMVIVLFESDFNLSLISLGSEAVQRIKVLPPWAAVVNKQREINFETLKQFKQFQFFI